MFFGERLKEYENMFEHGSSSSSQTGAMHSKYSVLQLTNPLKFQNTTIIPGSRYTPSRRSREYGATKYFSGYVFRGDMRYPEIIFEQGFTLQASVRGMHQLAMMSGSAIPSSTGSEGVSTSICVQAAAEFSEDKKTGDRITGCVYLIDATGLNGFAMPAPSMDPSMFSRFPILKKICEVCFPCDIPNSSVVGVLWPEGFPAPPSVSPVWPAAVGRLNLAVNPRYESAFDKGQAAAKKVVRLFNI